MFLSCPYTLQIESTFYISLNVKEHLARNKRDIWSLSDCNGTGTHNHLICKWTLNHLAELTKLFNWVLSTFLYVAFDCMFLSCPDVFHTESTLYICLNVKELLVRNRRVIWSLSDCNETGTHNQLVRKQILNHLSKLNKWLSWVVSTYLYRAFDCMFLSCDVRVSDWIQTLYLPECQGTPYSKQARCLKFKWLQRHFNPRPLSS